VPPTAITAPPPKGPTFLLDLAATRWAPVQRLGLAVARGSDTAHRPRTGGAEAQSWSRPARPVPFRDRVLNQAGRSGGRSKADTVRRAWVRVDGSGSAVRDAYGPVAERIAEVAPYLRQRDGDLVVDVEGLTVAPGITDILPLGERPAWPTWCRAVTARRPAPGALSPNGCPNRCPSRLRLPQRSAVMPLT
jgi:hypothetical protein